MRLRAPALHLLYPVGRLSEPSLCAWPTGGLALEQDQTYSFFLNHWRSNQPQMGGRYAVHARAVKVAATAISCGTPAAVIPPMRPASITPIPPGTGAMPP